jgi:hypothetical protein
LRTVTVNASDKRHGDDPFGNRNEGSRKLAQRGLLGPNDLLLQLLALLLAPLLLGEIAHKADYHV